MDLSYILNHLGEERENYFNAVVPPVIQSSNFRFPTVDAMRKGLSREFDEHVYTRGNNPTVEILRKKLAALEGTEDALVLSSGAAAISCAVIAEVSAGDHVICVRKPYTWTAVLLERMLPRFGVTHTMVDGRDPENFRKAIRPETKVIYLESPNSILFELQDIRAIATLAREHGIITMIDNSYGTPLYQHPAEMGIDVVIHTGTKYVAGHSDVVSGVICSTRERIRKIFGTELMTLGGIISPHDAWLMLRGLRTLPVRLRQSSSSAMKVAEFMASHPIVEKVIFPFHPTHEQYGLARRQMSGCSGMFSVLLKVHSFEAVEHFCESLKMFLMAVSWGGFESLVFPAVAMFDQGSASASDVPWNLVRLYIGLEEPDSLIRDLEQALEKVSQQ
jgi:cystathionine beta-lyase